MSQTKNLKTGENLGERGKSFRKTERHMERLSFKMNHMELKHPRKT
jgi:hypothetical protein